MRNARQLILMEDSEADARLFELAFRSLQTSLQLVHCRDGGALLEYVQNTSQSDIALIVLDLNAPGMSGIDVLRHLRGRMEVRSVPILIFTNSQHPDDRARCFETGASAFFTKPMDIDEYDRSVRSFLQYIPDRSLPAVT